MTALQGAQSLAMLPGTLYCLIWKIIPYILHSSQKDAAKHLPSNPSIIYEWGWKKIMVFSASKTLILPPVTKTTWHHFNVSLSYNIALLTHEAHSLPFMCYTGRFNSLNFFHLLLTLAIVTFCSIPSANHIPKVTKLINVMQGLISSINTFHPWLNHSVPTTHTPGKISYITQTAHYVIP